ncbi:hypothetical protein JOC47_001725 [Halanaerobacter jeridensis]|uniref:Uncharacterized protein n=1 Tax=Halanaerobacter jeridensis TaxID=706427 RepID=A0A938XSA1_9FIRM|nr:hypothetical protein [Halanaerobacter jeridensis]
MKLTKKFSERFNLSVKDKGRIFKNLFTPKVVNMFQKVENN